MMEASGVCAPDKPNRYEGATVTPPSENYRLIPLTQGQFAKVSHEDFESLACHKWHAVWCPYTKTFYAETWLYSPVKHREWMHRIIMGCSKRDGKQVDHANGETTDNQRSNLRLANHSQNMMNRKLRSISSSGHRGVSLCKQTGKWKARLVLAKKEIWLGRFAAKEAAIAAVKSAHIAHYGEYARTT